MTTEGLGLARKAIDNKQLTWWIRNPKSDVLSKWYGQIKFLADFLRNSEFSCGNLWKFRVYFTRWSYQETVKFCEH